MTGAMQELLFVSEKAIFAPPKAIRAGKQCMARTTNLSPDNAAPNCSREGNPEYGVLMKIFKGARPRPLSESG
ncbi:hypothetical protein HaLaN_19602 [Haematococcus lacustris]|uniref:Uncharacterized protein n=1 Tax=Haematococcus lacustris TaxID=44745 RepID=A0A699ZM49_HAELA|nr:hypothetical protein HaLaN_19602 [Haematococcus lacustris]